MANLEEIAARFKNLRKARRGQVHFPPSYRKEAIDLLNLYPIKQVEAALGVNERSLYRWQQAARALANPPSPQFAEEIKFIEIENPAAALAVPIQIELTRRTGETLKISNARDVESMKELILSFLRAET